MSELGDNFEGMQEGAAHSIGRKAHRVAEARLLEQVADLRSEGLPPLVG